MSMTVLLVEDDRELRATLSEALATEGYRVLAAASLADGRAQLAHTREAGGIDLIFANESEALQLAGAADLDTAIERLLSQVRTLVFTRGAAGALAFEGGVRSEVPAIAVQQVVDTTGAGDLFAAGFLAARCKGHGIERQLISGGIAACSSRLFKAVVVSSPT